MAINWLHSSGGLATKATYGPMISDRHEFTSERCKPVRKAVLPGVALFPKTEALMAQWLCAYGAISIAVDATPFSRYTGGVIQARSCTTNVDHAVILVGIDRNYYKYTNGNYAPVWIVQNSWGVNRGVQDSRPYRQVYGDSGFYLLEYGTDTCGVARYATIPQSATYVR